MSTQNATMERDDNDDDDVNRNKGTLHEQGQEQQQEEAAEENPSFFNAAIVIVAKVPTVGKSKTRLIPLMGAKGAAEFAQSMLLDVLHTIDRCNELNSSQILKVVLYAPGNDQGLQDMKTCLEGTTTNTQLYAEKDSFLLSKLDTNGLDTNDSSASYRTAVSPWKLLPIESNVDLKSSDLGHLLQNALNRVRDLMMPTTANHSTPNTTKSIRQTSTSGPVLFFGMDSPILPLEDMIYAIHHHPEEAVLCPSDDGGYGMLSVPGKANAQQTFVPSYKYCSTTSNNDQNITTTTTTAEEFDTKIPWSHSLTAMAQLKALTLQNIPIQIGSLMYDMDEPSDIHRLVARVTTTAKSSFDKDNKNDDTSSCIPLKLENTILQRSILNIHSMDTMPVVATAATATTATTSSKTDGLFDSNSNTNSIHHTLRTLRRLQLLPPENSFLQK